MLTLKVKPESKEPKSLHSLEELRVDPVEGKTKAKLVDWLTSEVKLLKFSEKLQS